MQKKLLSVVLAVCLTLSLFSRPAAAAGASFPDMPGKSDWARAALGAAVDNGLLNGIGGRLLPGGNLTRAQLAAVLVRAFGARDAAQGFAYSDVPASAWYADYLSKAVRMGVLKGDGVRMRPQDPVTRQEAFTVLARALRLADGSAAALAPFSDAGSVAPYAVGPLSAMVGAGYAAGKNGRLAPTAAITRAEFAQVMYRLVSGYYSSAGTYTAAPAGNLMVNVPGVTLRDLTISGDLIVGEGVGSGDLTLDNVKIAGRLVVRGGGENSIIILNRSSVGSVVVGKTGDGGVRVRSEEGCRIDAVEVADGKDEVILAGVFNQVTVSTDAPVILRDSVVTGLTVSAAGADVSLAGSTAVSAAEIVKSAAGASVAVAAGTKIAVLNTAAENVTVSGSGTVSTAAVSGSNTAVNIAGARVTAAEGAVGVTQNGTAITPPAAASSGGGGGGSTRTEITVTTDAELAAAIRNTQYTKIWVGDQSSSADQSFTIPAAAGELTLGAFRELCLMRNADGNPIKLTVEAGAALRIDGFLLVEGYLRCDGALTVGAAMEISPAGVVENRGSFTVGSPCFMFENKGFIANAGTFGKNASGSGINYGESRDYTAAAALSAAPTLLAADLTVSSNTVVSSALFVPMGVRLEVAPSAALTLDADTRVAGGLWCVAADGSSAGSLTVSAGRTLTILSGDNGTGSDPRSANGTVSVFCGAMTNSGTIDVVHGLLHVFGANSSFVNHPGGVVRSSGGLVLFTGWDAASACASVTNNGAYRAGPYAGPDNFSLIDGDNSGVDQEYLGVATEAELRQAMADGAAAGLEADVTVVSNLTLTRPVAVWSGPSRTLSVADGAALTLGAGGALLLLGNLAVKSGGGFVNGTDGGGIVAGAASVLTVETGGVFTNSNHFGMLGTINNGGTFTVTADGGASHLWLVGGKLNNLAGGVFTNEQAVQAWSYTDDGANTPASISNAGSFSNGALSSAGGSEASLEMTGGSLTNTGAFVNNGRISLNGTALAHAGGTFATYNSSGLELTGGSFDLRGARANSFVNEGYMKIVDTYGRIGGDSVCEVSLGGGDAFSNDSRWLDYTAAVFSESGLAAAETAQSGKKSSLGGGSSYYGLSVYDRLDFCADMSVASSKTLSAFDMYWIVSAWDSESEAEIPYKLTVSGGAALTVAAGSALHVGSGSLVVNGTLATAAGSESANPGRVEIWPTGGFAGSGTVANGGEFIVRYVEDDGAHTFGRTAAAAGTPADAENLAIVHSGEGFAAAVAQTSPVSFSRVEIKDGSNIALTASAAVAQRVSVEAGSGLIVPHGMTLTYRGPCFNNDGDVGVLGVMTIERGSDFNNNRHLEVGALTGGETAAVAVAGSFHNNGAVSLFATGALDASGGSYYGEAPTGSGVYTAPD